MAAKIWQFNASLSADADAIISARVLVGGCFDVLHYGHVKFLQAAKALGGFLSIALEADEKIIHNKHRRPIHTQLQRAEILAHLRSVDEIILLPVMYCYEDYLAVVQHLKPQFLAVTAGDPQFNNKQKQAEAVAAQLVVVTDPISTFSSSHVIKEKDWI